MPERKWYLVTYPDGTRFVEWLSKGEAEVKSRAVGKEVKLVSVVSEDGLEVRGLW